MAMTERGALPVTARIRRRRGARAPEEFDRSVISDTDRKRRRVMIPLRVTQAVIFVALVVAGLGPLLWLAKAAISTPIDIASDPLGWFPSGVLWSNLATAWVELGIGRHLLNTLIMCTGAVIVTLVTCITGGYVLSVLRPKWGPVLNGAILATLFIPGVVSLVPVYKLVLDLPVTGGSLLNTYWAIWLPAGANAFGVLIMRRFFDSLPRELFEAARIDGAGPMRVLLLVVVPLSRPIIGVLALLTFVNTYKEFLWPLLVLRKEELQPISVALTFISKTATTGELMAALFISVIIPVALFLAFQRQFLTGVSAAGGVKG
jgi:multiple sugar transport system permease protein